MTVNSVKVKGLHDGQNLAILLEYEDPTDDPKDAAAVEFMVGDKKAHFAHGQPMLQVEGGPVNIWFWKKENGQALDMSAKGFKTLKPLKKNKMLKPRVRGKVVLGELCFLELLKLKMNKTYK